MKKESFCKRFLAVNLPNPLLVTFSYFTRVGRAPTLRTSKNFSFGAVILRRGRVTDIVVGRNGLVSIKFYGQ